jgi:hypothetical protein
VQSEAANFDRLALLGRGVEEAREPSLGDADRPAIRQVNPHRISSNLTAVAETDIGSSALTFPIVDLLQDKPPSRRALSRGRARLGGALLARP